MEVVSIVLFIYLGSMFFWEQPLPVGLVEWGARQVLSPSVELRLARVTFGFRHGLRLVRPQLLETAGAYRELAGADEIFFLPLSRRLTVIGARYPRLPDSYYAPSNQEKNSPVKCVLPPLGNFQLTLVRPDILSVRPSRVTAEVEVSETEVRAHNLLLSWPDRDERRTLTGSCVVDFDRQLIEGEVHGLALQEHIRPMLVALDLPSSLPYFDAFTEVPGSVPASCGWKVNLVNNDFDLDLDLHPNMGKYQGVRMRKADGQLHLHVYTRGKSLNYRHVIGPIHAVSADGRNLDGTVKISGTNGYNTVDVEAKSAMPLADLLKIGGFVDDYVGKEIFGDSECKLQFRFPRAMTNNYEVLNGEGTVSVRNGYLMRMKGFQGLLAAMPEIAPGISWFTDTTRATGSYVIDRGVVRVKDLYLEGTLFSLMMTGTFDAVRNRLDFTVRVQFTRKDTLAGRILHPLAWPFTKLLLEFKLTGTPQAPQWTYLSVIHRLMEATE